MVSSSNNLKNAELSFSSRSFVLRSPDCFFAQTVKVFCAAASVSFRLPMPMVSLKCGVLAFGEKIDLVAQVAQVVIDRRGGKQKHFGFHPALDDVIHEPLVAAFADDVALLVALARRVVAEVVGLVNDDEIEIAPIESRQIDAAGFAALAAQIGMGQHVVAEPVFDEGIERLLIVPIDGPVFT